MSRAASFAERWARGNLCREASEEELTVLSLFLSTCNGDEEKAGKRARRYYEMRGPGGLTELWHRRNPDDEDILSSCQDAYIVPLQARSVGGRRLTLIRLPAPTAMDCCRQRSAKALLSRWFMILDIRLKEDPTPGEEMVFIDVRDAHPADVKWQFKGSYWKDFISCMKLAYPIQFCETHVINTKRLKLMSFLMLRIGLYPWGRKIINVHNHGKEINKTMGLDYFPVEGLPYEYGGKAGAMKDLNDEWTKKVLSNSKWLQSEERRFYETQLKPAPNTRTRHKSAVRISASNGSYNMITRTYSCKSLHRQDDLDEGTYGAYRTLKIHAGSDFCV